MPEDVTPSIAIQLGLEGTSMRSRPFGYRLAGTAVFIDRSLPELGAFEASTVAMPSLRVDHPQKTPREAQMVHSGPGWIDTQWRNVQCWQGSHGYWVSVDSQILLWVAPDGRAIVRLESGPIVDLTTVIQAVLGPALILALALQGTWCLHASAVAVGDRVIAFVGESGYGKSTLAAFLGQGANGWTRIGDDVLPIASGTQVVDVLPRFPQLKLPPNGQPGASWAERGRLSAVYSLSEEASWSGGVDMKPLSSCDATLMLVRHTVAARLFGPDLLTRHLTFCAEAALHLPARQLAYQRDYVSLPGVQRAIAADLDRIRHNSGCAAGPG